MEPQDTEVRPKANPSMPFRSIVIAITSVLVIAAALFAFHIFANSNPEKTATLPSKCDLPQLQADYGSLVEGGAPVEIGDGWDPSTFYCTGNSVGNWMGETFIGIGPQVHYSNINYYTPEIDKDQAWLSSIEQRKSGGPYDYVETSLDGYPLLYDCYMPNPGDPEVMTAALYVQGIVVDYWNEGCLDQNTKYLLEAASSVTVN
jgi:hypothetical protein